MNSSNPNRTENSDLQRELVTLLYDQSKGGLITNFIVSIMILFYALVIIKDPLSWYWFGTVQLILWLRIFLVVSFKRNRSDFPLEYAEKLFFLFTSLTGTMWGLASVLFYAPEIPYAQVFILIMVAGMTAGALPYLSPMPYIYITYTVGTLAPFTIFSFIEGWPHNSMGIMGLLYFMMNIFSSKKIGSVIQTNITSRQSEQSLAKDLKQTVKKLNDATTTKSLFVSSMSHELRTPLNAILGYAQLLKMEDSREELLKGLEEITYAGNHLLELVNDILDLSRIESTDVSIEKEPVKLDSLVNRCVELMSPTAKKRGISISVKNRENRVVMADIRKLNQILLNLISNAVKYNFDKGFVHVEVVPVVDTNQNAIVVRNSGVGIPEDQLSSLFEPFNRLGAEKSTIQGTGLGLYITKKLVELMDGSISVESSSAFTEVRILLPHIRSGSESPSVQRVGVTGENVVRFESKPYSILYIEDTSMNIALVERTLQKYRSHVTFEMAMSGSEGVEKAGDLIPNVILVDIQLPDISGFRVLEMIRHNRELDDCAVIALSADARQEVMKKAIDAGFDLYLTKPFQLDHLLKTLDTAAFDRDSLSNHLFKSGEMQLEIE